MARSPDLERFDELLGVRLLRLEISLGAYEAAILIDARRFRDALAEAGRHAEVAPGAHTFDAVLAETLTGVYAWIFGALDAVFNGEYLRPLPRRLFGELADHTAVAAMRAQLDPSLATLPGALVEISRSAAILARVG